MSLNNFKLEKYFRKNSDYIKELIPYSQKNKYKTAIVIPVYNEVDYLFKTLESILRNKSNFLDETIIILVVNNSEDISRDTQAYINNQETIKRLEKLNCPEYIHLHWIDCSSRGYGLSGKGGVGVARKIGMDSCLKYLDLEAKPIICSLDADTLTAENYLEGIINFFNNNKDFICGIVSFKHLNDASEAEYKAICEYEYYLSYYVDMLKYAGSPYAYHAIGSTMVFRADAYIKSGGMKQNTAGEDFYFLQDIRKIGKIGEITQTSVYQSSRCSDRVPFGTGPTIADNLSGTRIMLYNPGIFKLLKKLLFTVNKWILAEEYNCSDYLYDRLDCEACNFLDSYGFKNIWKKIVKNNIKINSIISEVEARNKLLWCFNIWFDAFRTLKFVHYMERTYPERFPRLTINEFKKNDY